LSGEPAGPAGAALARLRSPDTWCDAAAELVALGDRRALAPLVAAFDAPWETSKLCLLDAMRDLGATEEASRLMASPDAEERRLGARLADLLADEGHLAALERAVTDADPRVRASAREALAHQRRTPAWEATAARLLGSEDPAVRALAVGFLAGRRGDAPRDALRERLSAEPDPEVRAAIEAALAEI
jgi:hypothetical protein